MQASAGNLKKVQLELGGKGANIVFDDADLAAAVNGSAWAIFHNQGQACIAGSRLVLHERIADEFLDRFTRWRSRSGSATRSIPRPRWARSRACSTATACSATSTIAREQGGEVVSGGKAPDATGARARLLRRADGGEGAQAARDRVAQEEVFGPFVTVLTFKNDDEALAIANGTEYGLGSGLWTRDLRARTASRASCKAGMVWINSYKRVNPGSPFGGVGRSGYGREMGFDAMREYTQVKSVWVNVDAKIPPWYPR